MRLEDGWEGWCWLSERGSNPRAVLWPVKEIATALPSELSENLLRELESNQRPPGYGPSELPTALPRDVFDHKDR